MTSLAVAVAACSYSRVEYHIVLDCMVEVPAGPTAVEADNTVVVHMALAAALTAHTEVVRRVVDHTAPVVVVGQVGRKAAAVANSGHYPCESTSAKDTLYKYLECSLV